jgi:hypothetical protein
MEGQTERFGGVFLTQTADPRVAAWRTSDHNSVISGYLPVKSNGFVVFKAVATGTIVNYSTKTRKPLGVLPSHHVTRLVSGHSASSLQPRCQASSAPFTSRYNFGVHPYRELAGRGALCLHLRRNGSANSLQDLCSHHR